MAQCIYGNALQEVEVTPAAIIPHPGAVAGHQRNRQAVECVHVILLLFGRPVGHAAPILPTKLKKHSLPSIAQR